MKYAADGVHSKNYTFKFKDRQNNTERDITVYDYFQERYNIRLQFPMLPLVMTTRDGVFPMEVCSLVANQKYPYKLSPEQTASMIKFAVTRPKERLQAINHGVGMLKWHDDPYLKHYGVKIDPNMTVTAARLLPAPEVQYLGSKANPGTSGRWDLRGKKFFLPNTEPLKSWGVCVIDSCCSEPAIKNFMTVFIQTYIGHGGKVENKNPVIYNAPQGADLAETVVKVRQMAGNQGKSHHYSLENQLKHSNSQCIATSHSLCSSRPRLIHV
jgi:eukaryotic translation initiation factor 2C